MRKFILIACAALTASAFTGCDDRNDINIVDTQDVPVSMWIFRGLAARK